MTVKLNSKHISHRSKTIKKQDGDGNKHVHKKKITSDDER